MNVGLSFNGSTCGRRDNRIIHTNFTIKQRTTIKSDAVVRFIPSNNCSIINYISFWTCKTTSYNFTNINVLSLSIINLAELMFYNFNSACWGIVGYLT